MGKDTAFRLDTITADLFAGAPHMDKRQAFSSNAIDSVVLLNGSQWRQLQLDAVKLLLRDVLNWFAAVGATPPLQQQQRRSTPALVCNASVHIQLAQSPSRTIFGLEL